MMAARIQNADAAFLPQPVDAGRGVLGDDGTPDELLLPFRTTAMLLADAQYVGSMRLPGGSHNHVFRKPDNSLVMVVWGDGPATEELFLGEGIVHLDPWGRDIPLVGDAQKQAIRVWQVPSFVLGLNELLGMALVVVAQPEWRGHYRETLLFAAVIYYVVSHAMARASRSLELQREQR